MTPPGVALDGGLTVTKAGSGPPTAGIEPTDLLTYSPLAQTSFGGRNWPATGTGLVPGSLVADPSALAAIAGGGELAVLRGAGGNGDEVVHSGGNITSGWSDVVSRAELGSSAGGSSCRPLGLASVAFAPGGTELVGAACSRPGTAGIFSSSGGDWTLDGPPLPAASAATTEVPRLFGDGSEAAPAEALVWAGASASGGLLATWMRSSSSSWSSSPLLPLSIDDRLVASGADGREVFAVVDAGGSISLATARPGGAWQRLQGLPTGTAAVALTGGAVDALTVDSTVLTDWRHDATTGGWRKLQTVHVPVPFGSSS